MSARGREDGFTLLEVLVALAILAGAVVTILTVMNSHLAASLRLSERADAALVAKERLEEALVAGVPAIGQEDPARPGWSVSYSTEDAGAGLERICAEVRWGKGEMTEACAWAEKKRPG